MKNNIQLIFFVILLLLSCSCTMQKRVYNRGIHFEWFESKGSEKVVASNTNKPEKKRAKQMNVIVNETNTFLKAVELRNPAVSSSIFVNPTPAFVTYTAGIVSIKKNNKSTLNKSKFVNKNASVGNEIKNYNRTVFSSSSSSSENEDNQGNIALSILGWILWGLGIFMIIFVSILLGIMAVLLGLLLITLGKKKKGDSSKSENKADNKSDYIDVVYLKNGGVIKGMIIEQTPNVQIKIQTKDGSIFVYKFDEIEKITKEQSK